MRDFIEDVAVPMGLFVLAIFCLIALIVGGILGLQYLTDKPACAKYGQLSMQETYWSLGTSCIVKVNGEWVDYSVAAKKKQEITIKQK